MLRKEPPAFATENDAESWFVANVELEDDCTPRYKQPIYIPEALFADIEVQVVQSMMGTMQIPSEDSDNKRNINRQ